ncbi:MAG: hypothetical protein F4X99_23800 [Gammaproteobacteria bacterium]|nr:hypothetical protein [Gammaproteobacteria bacterium]MYE80747.1 hypothetical protein [Gammaproteobacteria bacterium]
MAAREAESGILYEPDERAPPLLATGFGLQFAILTLSSMIVIPMTVFRSAGSPEALVTWAAFASLIVGGGITALQAFRLGRIGAGYMLITGASGAAIAICADALEAGGPGLLAMLVCAAGVFQLVFSARLSLFRRILTPTVSGTVLLLLPVTVVPVTLGLLDDVPRASAPHAASASALTTVLVLAGIMLKGGRKLRPWAPVVGIAVGSAVAASLGAYDVDRVLRAGWIGAPELAWPGLDLDFGPSFWGLLPGFLLVIVVLTIRTISASVGIQGVSWRRRRAVDFRTVQGAVTADGVCNVLAGLAGTIPNGARTTTVTLTQLTGVGSRAVGVVLGLALAAMAFFPKLLALVLAVPGPVLAGYVVVMIASLFTLGITTVAQDGLDHRKALIVGFSFWFGFGCQFDLIFPEYLSGFAGGLLDSGLTAGGLVAIFITVFLDLTAPRRKRLAVALEVEALPQLREFLAGFAGRRGWDAAMLRRVEAASEESLLTLLGHGDSDGPAVGPRRLLVTAREDEGDALIEFVAAPGEQNIEDSMTLLGERATADTMEREVSLRLLRHLASSVRHQQYHETDILTVRVEPPGQDQAS